MAQAWSEYPLQGISLNSAPGSVAAFLCLNETGKETHETATPPKILAGHREIFLRYSLWFHFHGCDQGINSAEHLKYNLKKGFYFFGVGKKNIQHLCHVLSHF